MPERETMSESGRPVQERNLSLRQASVTLGLAAAAIFLFDIVTPPHLDLPILYLFVVLLCLRCPRQFPPLAVAGICIILTFVPPVLVWTSPLSYWIISNRTIIAIALGITAVLVANRQTTEAALRASQQQLGMRVEERTADLRKVNRALEAEVANRRTAEQSLNESLERLARTEAFSLVMVTHVGLDGRWLKVPARLCDLLGYSEAELLGGMFKDVTHPDDIDADWSQCRRLIRGDIKSFEVEKRYIRKDGGIVWVYSNCSGVYDHDGRLLHFLTYIRDITDRKLAEGALRKSQEQWRNVIETIPIGIAISTAAGRLLDVNTAAWTILGYESKEEFLRLAAASHYIDPADRQRRIDQVKAGQHVFEAQYKKKDGSLFWGRCTAALLGEHDGDLVLINAYEDITAQREYQHAIQHARDELQAANRRLMEQDQVRTRFLSVVSHELRTPMAAIKGFVDNMLNGVTGDLTEQQAHYLTRMLSNVDRLSRLIAQILDWSRLELGSLQLSIQPVSLSDLVRGARDNVQMLAAAKGIDLTVRVAEGLPPIQADPDKLEQILWNLVGNAIKFTPVHGQVTIECRRDNRDSVLIMVTDTGCGIAPAELPKVFDQFSGIMTAQLSSRGAQLGLYISKRLVLLHGGHIWVESEVGKGSRFFIRLPLAGTEVQREIPHT
jgi:PAS domain S-box-containing protein